MQDLDLNTEYNEPTDLVEIQRRDAASGQYKPVRVPVQTLTGNVPEGRFATPAQVASTGTAGGQQIRRVAMTGNVTLVTADAATQQFVPDADRDVILPAETAGAPWASVLCHVGSAYVLTIKRAGGTTLGTLTAGDAALVTWNGTEVKMF